MHTHTHTRKHISNTYNTHTTHKYTNTTRTHTCTHTFTLTYTHTCTTNMVIVTHTNTLTHFHTHMNAHIHDAQGEVLTIGQHLTGKRVKSADVCICLRMYMSVGISNHMHIYECILIYTSTYAFMHTSLFHI